VHGISLVPSRLLYFTNSAMDMWFNPPSRQQRHWDVAEHVPYGGLNTIFGDFDREFRRMNRELNRLERDFNRGGGQGGNNQLGSLVDRSIPITPNMIVDANGQRQAQFQFDTRGFNPDDITIRTENGNKLVVTGKHEDKGEDHHHFREFRRMIAIPEGANLEQMQSRLAPNGVLTIQAPYTPPAIQHTGDKVLPIKHERSDPKLQAQGQGGQQK